MAGEGTGVPNSFVCWVARSNQGWNAVAGRNSARLGVLLPQRPRPHRPHRQDQTTESL